MLVQVPKLKTYAIMLLKPGLISGWDKKLNTKSYLPANKYSGSDLNLSSHTKLPCEKC